MKRFMLLVYEFHIWKFILNIITSTKRSKHKDVHHTILNSKKLKANKMLKNHGFVE